MSPILQFLPLLLLLAAYAAFIRLAARVLKTSRVGWSYAFQFAGVVVALSIVGRVTTAYIGSPPVLIGVLFGLSLHLFLGGWFFRERALAADGQPLGWGGGAKLAALALGFMLLLAAILLVMVRVLVPIR